MNIRNAQLQDVANLAYFSFQAMGDLMTCAFGSNAHLFVPRHLQKLVSNEQTLLSYKNSYILEDNGKVVAAMTTLDFATFKKTEKLTNRMFGDLCEDVMKYESFWSGLRGALFFTVIGLIFKIPSVFLPTEGYILSLAVDDKNRGKGYGPMLLKHFEDLCRREEKTALRLDVAKDNDGAIRSYKRCGFVVDKINPLTFSMVKQLSKE